MRALSTGLSGPVLLEPTVHGDKRGFLLEAYRQDTFTDLGIGHNFVQHNHSRSRQGVVRGMHFQLGMAKLVRAVRGAVLDVLVDIRRGSSAFGQWEAFELDDVHHHQLYCPEGFAHGFCVLSKIADVVYGCSAYYDANAEGGFRYNDPEVGIEWPPGVELTPSARDAGAPLLSQIAGTLPFRHVG